MYTKKYQVFVSSTFNDLKEERNALMVRLLLDGFIPAGMELFGAIDEDQFEHIKRIIDLSDYYVVILGNRYGSMDVKGVSYTEKEFLYAKEKKVPVIAMLHSDPGSLQAKHAEKPATARKLERFRASLRQGRLVGEWGDIPSLLQNTLSSLHKEASLFARTGWVRADAVASVETLNELNELQKENRSLRKYVASLEPELEGLAGLDEDFEVRGITDEGDFSVPVPWRFIFASILPVIVAGPAESWVKNQLDRAIANRYAPGNHVSTVNDDVLQTIKIQLIAHRAIEVVYEGDEYNGTTVWKLTDPGRQLMIEAGAVRSSKPISV